MSNEECFRFVYELLANDHKLIRTCRPKCIRMHLNLNFIVLLQCVSKYVIDILRKVRQKTRVHGTSRSTKATVIHPSVIGTSQNIYVKFPYCIK